MSARDVDLEFEKAYQRLFSRSTTTEASSSAGSSSASKPVAEGLKAPHRPASSSPAAAEPSSHRVNERQHTPREDASMQALLRHHSAVKANPPSTSAAPARHQIVQRERLSQSSSTHAGLDALARYSRTDTSKGKARAQSSHLDTQERHVARNVRNPLASEASPPQQTPTPVPQAGAVAYYPYPHAQASYPISGALMGPGLTSMPGQAVTWAQPVMSAGPLPAMAYPGFSAQVTFSQPQFFASHPPQQLQPALTTLPQQYTHQQSIPATPIVHALSAPQPDEQHPSSSRAMSQHRQEQDSTSAQPSKGTRRPFKTTNGILEAKIRKILQASGLDFRTKGDTSPSVQARHYAQSVMGDFREKQRVKLGDKPKKKPAKAKPLLDNDGNVIRRKRGRPRIRPLTPELDVKPKLASATIGGLPLVKTEAQDGLMPSQAAITYPPTFDGSLPLPEHAGKPFGTETYTMFIHQSRRLRWLARQAMMKIEIGSEAGRAPTSSPPDVTQWSRWSNSIAAQLQILSDEPPSSNAAPPSAGPSPSVASQSQSQTDPAGLFPRDRRREYVALRKQLHSATRAATAHICIRRLIRYLAKAAAAADKIDSRAEKRKYVERKHRAAKLTKHMLRFTRPTALDVRKMWTFWAHAAHKADPQKGTMTPPSQQPRVSFASAPQAQLQPASTPPPPSIQQATEEGGPRIKLEPESPTKSFLLPARPAQTAEGTRVKTEPMLDEIMTPPLPPQSVAIKTESEIAAEPSLQHQGARTNSALFLRRNFRLYRLLGLSDLPLS